ncbi:E3 ubiquitin-protein ligase MARCHF3 [Mustelus asterias]
MSGKITGEKLPGEKGTSSREFIPEHKPPVGLYTAPILSRHTDEHHQFQKAAWESIESSICYQLLSGKTASRHHIEVITDPQRICPCLDQWGLEQSGPGRTQSEHWSADYCDIPICRICHEPNDKENLLSPCECSGTLGTVHRSCLEQWLVASCSSRCELCHFEFTLERMPRPLTEWLKDPTLQQKRRMLCGDIICFLFITPLASLSGWLCVQGTVDHFYFSSSIEAVGLLILSAVLITIYLLWTTASFRYHIRLLKEWRQTNQHVKLLIPKSQVLLSNKPNLLAQNSSIIISKETIV